MNNNVIAASLGLPEIEIPANEVVSYEANTIATTVDADFTTSRENILKTMESVNKAIEQVAQLADTSQSAKFYEVLTSLLKANLDASQSLLNAHKQKQDLQKATGGQSEAKNVTNNNLFVGTTADLLAAIDNEKD